jgi:hypothetical protein
MLHLASHFLVPVLLGLVAYPARWYRASLLMVATMAVDLDHLLAVPVYDPIPLRGWISPRCTNKKFVLKAAPGSNVPNRSSPAPS